MEKNKDIFEEPERLKNVEMSAIRVIMDKAAALRAEGKTVIALSAGEPNFNTPEPIKQATIKAINENFTHYGSNRGLPKLRELMAKKLQDEDNVTYNSDTEILFTTGGAEALNNVILGTINPGDEVIIFSPAFTSYKNLTKLAGGVCVELSLKEENSFHIDMDEVRNAVTDKTKMIIMNNPNNPTGAVYTYEEIKALCELAVEKNLLILSDEMYSQLVYEGKFYSVAAFPGMKERAIIVNGFSKTYAMTGWRLGYILADKRIMDHIIKVHQYSSTCSPTFIQVGMVESMFATETQAEVSEMIEEFRKRRELVVSLLKELPKITFCTPQGAFYCLINVSKAGYTGERFAEKLLKEKLVAVVPAISLGKEDACRDYIRISFAASKEDIIEAIKRMKEVLQDEKS